MYVQYGTVRYGTKPIGRVANPQVVMVALFSDDLESSDDQTPKRVVEEVVWPRVFGVTCVGQPWSRVEREDSCVCVCHAMK